MPNVPERILVVDDDEAFGGLVREALTEQGFVVVLERDAEAALAHAGNGFRAAVLDLVMPGMGGLELADRLRVRDPDLPIVILTGQGDKDTVIEGLHHGMIDYVEKSPFDLARLRRGVERAAGRARLLRENRELLERLTEQNRLLKALQSITAELAGELHLDRILSRLVRAAKELTGTEAGRVVLLSRNRGETLLVETSVGDGADTIRGARLQLGESISALVAERAEPLLLARARDHGSYSHRCDELPTTLGGYACAPLRHGAVFGALTVAGRRDGRLPPEARDLLAALALHAAVAISSALANDRSVNFFTHTCEILISYLESLDIFHPGHSASVAALSDMLTRKLGLSDPDRRNVHFGALLHDIGKARVDPTLLKYRGLLSPQGRARMEAHPTLGVELLRPITLWEGVLPAVQSHHERWDGSGYPWELKGEEIPLGARIIALTDAFDVMTRNPYGRSRSAEEAIAELEACAGTHFDPRLTRLFSSEYRAHGRELRRYRVAPEAE